MMRAVGIKSALLRGSLVFALAAGTALAQTEANGNVQRRGAEVLRQSQQAENDIAAGRSLLQRLGLRRTVLQERQDKAETELRGAQARAQELLRTAAGRDAAAQRALAQLDALLLQPERSDSAAGSAAAAPLPLLVRSISSSLRSDPAAEDLQPTLDAPITPAIQAQADALGREPVALFEWVRRQIAYVPGSGSLQGAQGVFETRRGNATDTASLLVALLRASGVHARYVTGNVEIDSQRLMRWLAVDRIEAVTELFTEAGVRFDSVVVGGQVARVRFEHTWVEAWIDFAPSRGARHRTGDAWVALDASYKDLNYSPGIDLAVLMAIDTAASANALGAAATLDGGAGFISALAGPALAAQLDAATQRLRNALQARNLGNARLRDLLPHATDTTPDYPFFLGNLAYSVVGNDAPVAVLADAQRHRLRWSLRSDDNGQPGAEALLLDQPTVALAGKRIDLRFVPAAAEDALVLQELIAPSVNSFSDLPDSVPAYLVRMRAELWLDDTRLAQSPALDLGRTLHGELLLRHPAGSEVRTRQTAFVGEPRALATDWQGGAPALLGRSVDSLRAAQQAIAAGTPVAAAELPGTVLRIGGIGHYAASGAYQTWLAGLNKVSFHRAPSATTAYAALEVAAPLGLLTSVHPAGLGISDVSPRHIGARLDGGNEPRFAHQGLSAQSSFGHLLLEQLYPGNGRSAARVFNTALAANQRVYSFAPTQSAGLAALNLPLALRAPLQAALAAGDSVTVTAAAQTLDGWNGFGAKVDFAQGRGGNSFIYGTTRAETGTALTGASVSSAVGRGVVFTGWLGEQTPPRVIALWQGELEPLIAGGTGLVGIAQDPLNVAVSERVEQLVAGTVLDQVVGGQVDPLISQHLWSGLVSPVLSVAPLLDPLAPVVSLSVAPRTIDLGQSTRIRASASDNRGVVSLLVTAGGDSVTLVNGEADYTPTRAGVIPIVARARDAAGNLDEKREELLVRAPGDATPPLVEIISPADDDEITKPVQVTGSVVDDSLRSWTLGLRPGNSPEVAPVILAQGDQQVSGGVLGTLDPTLLMNGVYILILHAEDANGAVSDTSVQVRVNGDMKIGHFSITFEEVEVPLQGIPIRITRTYDTRQSKEKLDFGYGWSIDYQNVRVRESRKMGYSWRMAQNGGGFAPFCVRPAGEPTVTITLPNGEVEQFRAKWFPECQQWMPPIYGNLVFEPVDSRTSSRLEQTDYGQLRVTNLAGGASDIIDLDNPGEPVDPRHYKLTTAEGMVYFLDQAFGIQRIVDPAGNTITYTPQGVVHSTGVRVDFVRDAQNRITDIVLPDARRLKYSYNAAGDLAEFKDAGGNATKFGYLPSQRWPHYLQDIIDPRGVRAVRQEYDDDGRLVATIDADNKRMEYTHNIAGRTETVKNRRGHATTYVYDDNGWVLSETNALGEQTVRTYNSNGDVLTIKDPLDRVTTMTYDPRGNMLTEKNAANETVTRTWSYFNGLLTEHDGLNRLVRKNKYYKNTMTGEDTQYLSQSENGAGEQTYFVLDMGQGSGMTGNIKAVTLPSGATMSLGYDANGYLSSERDPLGAVVGRSYDASGRVTKETRQRTVNGQLETVAAEYRYDARGLLIWAKDADGAIVQSTFDAVGLLTSRTDAMNRTVRYEYDSQGRQTRTIYADNLYEEVGYDPEGNVVSERDRAGRITRMRYDEANRLVETILPDETPTDESDNPRKKNGYDSAGQLVWADDENGKRTTFRYDDAGRQTHLINPLNKTSESVYDDAGRRVATIDAAGNRTQYLYDAANRVQEVIYPDLTSATDSDNPRIKFEYDKDGRKTAETDELGRMTRFVYDKAGKLVQVVLPNPASGANPELVDGQSPANAGTLVTRFGYDEQGAKTSQTDAEGRTSTWTYDKLGRLITRKLPMGQVESYAYNLAGQQIRTTTFNNEEIQTGYDPLGRVEKITLPQGRIRQFHYSANNLIERIDEAGQSYSFAYDVLDRLSRTVDANSRWVAYEYDKVGNRTRLTSANQEIGYQFDDASRLASVTHRLNQGTPQTTTFQYDDVGRRSAQVNSNGTSTAYGYNPRGQLTSITHRGNAAAVLLGLNYTLNAAGLRTELKETIGSTVARTTTWTYDAAKRLTNETVAGSGSPSPNRNSTWTYDKVGNRKTEFTSGSVFRSLTNTYDNNDRLLTEQGSPATNTYRYDDAGNLLEKKQGGTVIASYSYDAENRLTRAIVGAAGATQASVAYRYDPNGIRRGQSVTTATTESATDFVVDVNLPYAEAIENWDAVGVPGTPLPAPTLQSARVFGDDLIAQAQVLPDGSVNGSTYHADGLGSTRLLTSNNAGAALGTATDRYQYFAFGEADPRGSSGTTGNSMLFAGEQYDAASKLYYLRARYLDPASGRFTQRDSFEGFNHSPASLHRYAYASNAPSMWTDPSGHMNLTETSVAQNIQSTLLSMNRTAGTLLRIYNRFDQFRSYMDLLGSVAQVIQLGSVEMDNIRPVGASGLLGGVDIKEAIESAAFYVPRSIMVGVWDWTVGYINSSKGGAKITSFFLGMPMPVKGLGEMNIPTGINVDFLNYKVPMRLKFGSKKKKAWGQLIGFGATMKIDRQLIRMDYHVFDPKHGGDEGLKGYEIAVLKDRNFHYHVMKWNQ